MLVTAVTSSGLAAGAAGVGPSEAAPGAGPSVAADQAVAGSPGTHSTVFERGADGYHTFRIPAVVEAADGTLLAFAEGRVDNPSDDGDIDLVLKRSADGGRSWGPLQVVADDGPNKWGNPVPIVDEATGRIILNTTRTGGDVTGADVRCGRADAEQTRRSFIQYSDDHGTTWSEPEEITADVRPDDWRHFVGGPGHGIQLAEGEHAGRLVIPGNHGAAPPPDSGRECSDGTDAGGHALYSDDGGATWHLGAVDRPGDGVLVPNESAAVERADGTIYFSARDQGTSPGQRLDTTSADGGASFAGPYDPVTGVVTSKVQGSLLRLAAGGGVQDRILLATPGHATARENLTLWSSFDGGDTWRPSLQVYDGPSGYSDLADLGGQPGNRVVGVLFENGERFHDESALPYHHRISFARVPERQLGRPGRPQLTTPDVSGHGNDGHLSGDPERIDGVTGSGLALEGDYIELPLNDELAFGAGTFTAAAWFRTEYRGSQAIMWAHSTGSEPKWWIRLEPGQDRIRTLIDTDQDDRFLVATGDLADGEWHHVAITRDDDGLAFYLDGELADSSGPVPGSVSAEARTGLRIGARVDGINNPLIGSVDEVWLFDQALTADEVATLVADNDAPQGPAVAHLPLERLYR
ncbi:hypothetical protein G1H10_15485 [Phytoactinopolyspora halotolerans]|uniref:exo-alpha-sialidase n=2 Tax=Phytoactinopolyspora halotolerans TaxID=1981512 RepID=A0A6L9SAB2_9ACTN|nr:hypothetical protein [Phytoactinopolyspora halotolerans]